MSTVKDLKRLRQEAKEDFDSRMKELDAKHEALRVKKKEIDEFFALFKGPEHEMKLSLTGPLVKFSLIYALSRNEVPPAELMRHLHAGLSKFLKMMEDSMETLEDLPTNENVTEIDGILRGIGSLISEEGFARLGDWDTISSIYIKLVNAKLAKQIK